MKNKIISASILAADLANLTIDINHALAAGIDYIHFDVMDHHFVPNLTFGAPVCAALRKAGIKAPIDVHLMVANPEDFIEAFAKAGANLIIFHPETVIDVKSTVEKIRAAGMQVGLAFNPDKTVNIDPNVLPQLDLILLMSVNPGFAAQSFKDHVLDKITTTRKMLADNKNTAYLGVDGGVKLENIHEIAKAGADFFVIGSGLFHAKNYEEYMTAIRNKLEK